MKFQKHVFHGLNFWPPLHVNYNETTPQDPPRMPAGGKEKDPFYPQQEKSRTPHKERGPAENDLIDA